MRKIALLMATMLCFSSCSVAEDPAAALQLAKESLQKGIRTELSIEVPEAEAKAQLCCEAGEQSLVFHSPAALEGLTFSKSELGITISMEGLSEKVQSGDLLKSSAANCLFEALEALAAAEEVQAGEFPTVQYEGGELFLNWDGSIKSISCENVEFLFQ